MQQVGSKACLLVAWATGGAGIGTVGSKACVVHRQHTCRYSQHNSGTQSQQQQPTAWGGERGFVGLRMRPRTSCSPLLAIAHKTLGVCGYQVVVCAQPECTATVHTHLDTSWVQQTKDTQGLMGCSCLCAWCTWQQRRVGAKHAHARCRSGHLWRQPELLPVALTVRVD